METLQSALRPSLLRDCVPYRGDQVTAVGAAIPAVKWGVLSPGTVSDATVAVFTHAFLQGLNPSFQN